VRFKRADTGRVSRTHTERVSRADGDRGAHRNEEPDPEQTTLAMLRLVFGWIASFRTI